MESTGGLFVVGTGLRIEGQVTQEALKAIRSADKLFHLIQDILTHRWLAEINPTAESLYDAYAVGRPRRESYAEMTERILVPVRRGLKVCAAFYGHPGVFVMPAHAAIRRAREEGHYAEMLPGISGEDCLFADLGIDPGIGGCQSFGATDFLIRRRRFDPSSHLLLWQVGSIGVADFRDEILWNRSGVGILAATLAATYGQRHTVVVYEADPYPTGDFERHTCELADLENAPVTLASILYVPPLAERASDAEMRAALGMAPEAPNSPRG